MKPGIIFISLILLSTVLYAQETEDGDVGKEDFIGSYYNEQFKPFEKGSGYVGLAFSVFDEKSNNSKDILNFDRQINSKTLDYSVKFKGGYFFSRNHMAGLGYSIEREKSTVEATFLSDTAIIESVDIIHAFTPSLRSYFPLTKNKRLSLFNETKVNFGFGNGESEWYKNGEQTSFDTSDTFMFGIGLSPGVTFFALENFCFEIQLDVLGYKYEKVTTIDETGEEITTISNNVDFTLNLLTLNFGLAYYFPTKN
jgi:hypothetical protein